MNIGDKQMADVRVRRAGELDDGTPQTPGLLRLEAISARLVGSEHIWMGLSVLPPGGRTGWHHHGDSETALYVLRGVGRWWIGDRPDDVREAHPGDFVFVPPNVPHWEENASTDEPVEMIVARSTQEAVVVNLEGPVHSSEA
ncbi:MAG: cupin domain-containing protein [Candidatus Dormibacteraeota bacterium]|nr:cupin domain-containing protein [Candidatus Dormibacteraeota bacterium]